MSRNDTLDSNAMVHASFTVNLPANAGEYANLPITVQMWDNYGIDSEGNEHYAPGGKRVSWVTTSIVDSAGRQVFYGCKRYSGSHRSKAYTAWQDLGISLGYFNQFN